MGASNAMVACAQKKGETMNFMYSLRPGGGSDEALRFIAVLIASSLYLAFLLYSMDCLGHARNIGTK